jgi:GDP-4-dehydro-6-deoxy-D-mannose reductase
VRAFVTGINGFAGAHLASVLAAAGHDVRGISNRPEYRGTLPPDVPVYLADICDRASLDPYLTEYQPELVCHLAGFASPGGSRLKVADCLSVNVLGTDNVFEAVASSVPGATVIAVTTAHFHAAAQGGLVTEESPMEARGPYTISKICAHHLCGFYHAQRGLKVIEARPTNHYGPGQQPGFVVADFAKQVAQIQAGLAEPPVRVGNLDVARDFLYVEDVARAYLALAQKGVPGEAYCIGSGQPVRIREILDMLIELSGMDIAVEVDAAKVRPDEVPVVTVSSGKILRDTGWQPTVELREGLALTLDYWRSALAQG